MIDQSKKILKDMASNELWKLKINPKDSFKIKFFKK